MFSISVEALPVSDKKQDFKDAFKLVDEEVNKFLASMNKTNTRPKRSSQHTDLGVWCGLHNTAIDVKEGCNCDSKDYC